MTDTLNNLPKIVSTSSEDDLAWGSRLAKPFRQSSFLMMFGSRFSDQSDRRYMSKEHCLLYVHRRVASAKEALERQRHGLGRFYNRITGSDHRYVEMTGHVLDTILAHSGEPRLAPEQVPGTYRVRRDVAENLLSAFTAHMRAEGYLR